MGKAKKHSPEQIVNILRQIEVASANGKTHPLACREAGITEQTYYRWRKEYGGMKTDQAKRLKELEQENAKLKTCRDDGFECAITPDPHLRWVVNASVFQLEGSPVVDVCADVFGVGQYLMNCRRCPWTPILSQDSATVQFGHDLPFNFVLSDEQFVNLTNCFNFRFRAGNQDDTVCLKTLSLSWTQETLGIPVPVNQLSPQTISGRTTLTES